MIDWVGQIYIYTYICMYIHIYTYVYKQAIIDDSEELRSNLERAWQKVLSENETVKVWCCSVLQCGAVCCSELWYVVVCCSNKL